MNTPYVVHATFENGLLKPDEPLDLPSQTRVKLTVERVDPDRAARLAALEAFNRLCAEHPLRFEVPHLTRDELYDRP